MGTRNTRSPYLFDSPRSSWLSKSRPHQATRSAMLPRRNLASLHTGQHPEPAKAMLRVALQRSPRKVPGLASFAPSAQADARSTRAPWSTQPFLERNIQGRKHPRPISCRARRQIRRDPSTRSPSPTQERDCTARRPVVRPETACETAPGQHAAWLRRLKGIDPKRWTPVRPIHPRWCTSRNSASNLQPSHRQPFSNPSPAPAAPW